MPGIVNWSTTKLKLYGVIWVNLDGQLMPYLLDIVNAQLNWALNTIPTAEITLAIGREAISGFPANIHYLIDELKMQLPFQLYMSVIELANSYSVPVDLWPQNPFLIFEGYTVQAGFTKHSGGTVTYTLSLQHWLTDMNFSSSLSRSTNSLNPSQLSTSASFLGGFGIDPSFSAHTLANDYFTPENIQSDFWGLGLKPWMLKVCSQDILVDPDDPTLQDSVGRVNSEAERAMNRFEPFTGGYLFGVPMLMDPMDVLDTDAATQAIADDISCETFNSMASHTLWDKLVGSYSANYLFAIVPLVQSALIVPFQPGIRQIWQTIYAEEYDAIQQIDVTPRAIRGMRIFGGLGDQFGAFGLQQGEAEAQMSIGGAFDNPNLHDGMLRYVNSPRWMANIVDPSAFGQQAMAPNGIMGNALNPGAGIPLVGPRPGLIQSRRRPLMNLYAQSLYVSEVLKDRSCTIKGKLRFDMSPGSSVRLMINEEKFVKQSMASIGDNSLYGSIRAITHYLDAEGPSAATAINIGWLRSPLENTLDGTSVAGHPLWSTQWVGAPSIEQPEFVPRPNVLGWGQ